MLFGVYITQYHLSQNFKHNFVKNVKLFVHSPLFQNPELRVLGMIFVFLKTIDFGLKI